MSKFFWDAFIAANGRCVYCLKDLLASFEEFAQSQEDHLVPRSKGGPHTPENIVIACAVCNALKHAHSPTLEPFSIERRSDYINAARIQIAEQRQKKFIDYSWWISSFANRFVPKDQK